MSDSPAPAINPVYCALDTDDVAQATGLAARLADHVGGLKLGLQFFTSAGRKGVTQVRKASELPIFLDLKFHDIPNTVAGAVRASCALRPSLLTVHAAGGAEMMKAAARAADDGAHLHVARRPLILGVTVLTSLDQEDLSATGIDHPVDDQVRRLAELARESGLDGVVCSPHEVATLRADLGRTFKLVVPGVRPEWAAGGDQKRVMTPAEALLAGADVLVIGRPITASGDPPRAAQRIAQELASASAAACPLPNPDREA
ncbi:orotidine-5'-phosphate decarboxylase [Roseospirillum parvum]|uniref:Orotidine 5'-phosphate decarboxylase n=1 Tax=Roseospirillum parvum TaxID=83401 RepID=A0A1G8FS43_9PROT|nr:orotidine-5'-phosphate decarboxylase [Roseospirillum parvum]SDH84930.1 orotidine-5'-phosphate decarboxylase [Roseospirillum parvum]